MQRQNRWKHVKKMSKVYTFMSKEYKAKKWPYFGSKQLRFMFGNDCVKDLQKLIDRGRARKESGFNGTLIELLKPQDRRIRRLGRILRRKIH